MTGCPHEPGEEQGLTYHSAEMTLRALAAPCRLCRVMLGMVQVHRRDGRSFAGDWVPLDEIPGDGELLRPVVADSGSGS